MTTRASSDNATPERVSSERPRSKSLRPLWALVPFLKPYRGRMFIALLALHFARQWRRGVYRMPAAPAPAPVAALLTDEALRR